MEKIFISVIVPIYNVEKYLYKCLESIKNQTWKKFEAILIDDGSTDLSGRICDEWVQIDNRFRVIHKKNEGLMSAWMRGVEESKSDNIIFVDSDDWIAPRMFEVMFEKKEYYKVDMVVCNMCKMEGSIKERTPFLVKPGYYDRKKIEKIIYPIMLNAGGFQLRGVPTSRWGKMIKKNLIMKNLKYCDTNISFSEDLNIMFPVLLDCASIVFVDDEETDYFYRMNPSSILHSYNKTMYYQIQLVYKKLFQVMKEKEKKEFEDQILADYLAAIVQCYKNELMSKEKFFVIKKNIEILCYDKWFIKSANQVNWKKYGKLNRLIIYMMLHWNIFNKNVMTFFLYILKQYKMKDLEKRTV